MVEDTLRMQTLCRIATEVIAILKEMGHRSAVFGGLACSLYGTDRQPNDIDILVFPSTTTTTEELKKSVFDTNPEKFGLEPSLSPSCSHKILYYRLPIREGPHGFFRGNKCKIDLVIPGIMELPHLSSSDVHHILDIPVLPFFILVLQKLQGWDDRRMMYTYPKKLAKAPIDARDVQQLLMTPGLMQIGSAKQFLDEGVLTPSFISKSRIRIRSFCESFPSFRDQLLRVWNSMGPTN